MKYLFILALIFSSAVQAKGVTDANTLSQEKRLALREAASRADQIFGGLMLDQRCRVLSNDEYIVFAKQAKAIMNVVKQGIGQEKINEKIKKAKVVISINPYKNCGSASGVFIFAAKHFVESTYATLRKKE